MKNANAYLNSRRFAIEALKNFDRRRACPKGKRITHCDRASGNSTVDGRSENAAPPGNDGRFSCGARGLFSL
jgi:hypothetical protein